ncbi:M23 family metallopeptidase [Chitiniphilus purpureus]|uniref:M23 family metallopeptidase n=1 Tax=Chitiniphilus purpureus TaxID=2981137 RepID=A0ABY6DP33_9NEIS|nr:M23 family metallopeptidase [Chitiniphilus sp. CD1]UXY15978.1 M23 family metallopeptidase [Chitiniphilus sp. CD1]
MNIILVSSRFSRALHLGPYTVAGLVLLFALAAGGVGVGMGMLLGGGQARPLFTLAPSPKRADLDALAIQLGRLQAKLLRLDGLAKQVGIKTGIDVAPFLSNQPAPTGGLAQPERALSVAGFTQALAHSTDQADAYLDQMTLAQTLLLRPRGWQLPSRAPLAAGLQSSSFGWRIDPFSGRQNFHEGIDFVGPVGTPIHAAAAGEVVYAERHPQYGNMVELSHDNGLTSRYAHASKLLVKVGDKVDAGQNIAEVGSTGRSTGPHLHFEIRYKGVAQNPLRFMSPEAVTQVAAASD